MTRKRRRLFIPAPLLAGKYAASIGTRRLAFIVYYDIQCNRYGPLERAMIQGLRVSVRNRNISLEGALAAQGVIANTPGDIMLKTLSATAAAFALMTGLAVAQDQQTTSQERTTVQNPDGSQSVQANKSQTMTDGTGNQTTDKKSYNRTDNGLSSQESRSNEQHTSSPDGSTTNTEQSSTTSKPN